MNPFAYVRSENAASALAAIGRNATGRYVAGGTNLLDLMKDAVEHPALLIDINALPLRQIELREGGLFIGALSRMSDVAANALVRERIPAVAIALNDTASPQLRNMGSIGGNLLQRTRCAYFRDVATPCNKRQPASGCGALGGENRAMAVLGISDRCIATHASDLAVALMAYEAIVHTSGASGPRDIPILQFYRLPGQTPHVETRLGAGDLITGVTVPPLAAGMRSTYLKVRDRAQYEFALASAAVAFEIAGSTMRDVRIALGGVATVPWRSPEAEWALTGNAPSRAAFARAAAAALAGARGSGENDFKIVLAQRTLVRALEIAVAGS